MLHVIVDGGLEVFIVVVVHGSVASLLLLGGELSVVDLLSARASAAGQDVVCRNGFEVIVFAIFVFIDSYSQSVPTELGFEATGACVSLTIRL